MRTTLFLYLLLFSQFAFGGQEQAFMLKDHKHQVYFTTYQSKNMTRKALGDTAIAFRHCKMVDRFSFIKNEKLAFDNNITGAFYCPHSGDLRTYAIVKKFKH